MCLGINLRERVTPLKYTIDEDQDISSSEDENGEVFPKEKTTYEKWMMEVCIYIPFFFSKKFFLFLFTLHF